MASEIERGFLIADMDALYAAINGVEPKNVFQGYLSVDPDRTVRVRTKADKAYFTVKGRGEGIKRPEFEYPIPMQDAEQMLGMCIGYVKKERYTFSAGEDQYGISLFWEVDFFKDKNSGLVVAEIEFKHTNSQFIKPVWLGEEITDNPAYRNASLAMHPYTEWKTKHKP